MGDEPTIVNEPPAVLVMVNRDVIWFIAKV
jgi:hypothetical protein